MRLHRGVLEQLETLTGIDKVQLSYICATKRRPGRERALALARAARKMGKKVSIQTWLYGSADEIKYGLNS